jgi:arsenate reductase
MSDKPSVLFVCVHNAGRSQMAAGWLRHLAGDKVEVRSAGSEPGKVINPGKRYEDWKLDDPAGKGVAAVRPIRDEIRTRIEQLLADLVPAT